MYKIIDFDYAFKVALAEEEKMKELLGSTNKIVNQWLYAEELKE